MLYSSVVLRSALAALAVCTLTPAFPGAPEGVVQVFLLMGQSNMQGHGVIQASADRNEGRGSLEAIAGEDGFAHLRNDQGEWAVRDDVWIWYLDRKGPLTVGYGAREDLVGPELEFGHVVGEHFDEPVLLLKLAWGGKSLAEDFRPPSRAQAKSEGGPAEPGPYYIEAFDHVRTVLGDLETSFPELAGRKVEIAGFGWHQGWNDRVNQAHNDEYEANLAAFIRDVRKELDAPKLPFVIAETGMSGHEEKHPRALSLMRAQSAVAGYEEFRGNVAFVGTRDFYRPAEASPSRQAYHWNNNAETYCLIGRGMGQAMLSLMSGER